MELIALDVIILSLSHLNFIMHSAGCFLLICIYNEERHTVQQLYIIHLCLLEAIKNFLFIPAFYFEFFNSALLKDCQHYVFIIIDSLKILYYLFMYYITIDRMLAILLNYRYSVYWSTKNAKSLLAFSWLSGVVLLVSLSAVNALTGYDYHPYNSYVYLAFDIGFIIVAVFTYCFMFNEYKNSLAIKIRQLSMATCGYYESIFKVFRQSNFYISFLLITSFLLFSVIPDLIYTLYGVICRRKPHPVPVMLHVTYALYTLSDLADAFVYIFMQRKVRELMVKKLHHFVDFVLCQRKTEKLIQQDTLLRRNSLLRRFDLDIELTEI